MNFNKLRYVITVAEEQSITKAAKKLYISQPSLSQCIRSVEEDLGAELFVRGKSHVTLTPAGELYLDWARVTLNSARQLEEKLAQLKSGSRRQLDIGASMQRGAMLLPEAITSFYAEVPNCSIKIHEDLNRNLLEALKQDRLDMIIGIPSSDTIHFTSVPLYQERFLLAASKDIPIPCVSREGSHFPYVEKSVLIGKPIILLQESQYLGQIFRDLLLELNYTPSKSTECYNLETAHSLVSKNVGVTLLPELSLLSRRLPDVNYYFFNSNDMGRTVAAVYRKKHPQARDIEVLTRHIKNLLRRSDYPFTIV